jgi:hypothetical protein
MSFFSGIETTKPNGMIVHFDLCDVFSMVPSDSFERTVSFLFPSTAVCHISGISCFAKVRPSIVVGIAIDMVNQLFWPLASHVKYRQRTASIKRSVKTDLPIAAWRNCTGTDTSASKTTRAINAPSKYAGLRIVVD